MINQTDYERIGRLAYAYYITDCERFNSRVQRAIVRKDHPCTNERDIGDGHVEPYPCWQYTRQPSSISSHLPEWCDDCKVVQPYYEAYQKAATKARVAKCRLTKAIKAKMLSEAEE